MVETKIESDRAGIEHAVALLRAGQPVAVPTETVYGLAADAASRTGIDPAILKKMLPLLTMLVGGYFSARAGGSGAQGSGGLGDIGSILGATSDPAADFGHHGGGVLGGLGRLLDIDGDGNALDDILNLTGRNVE